MRRSRWPGGFTLVEILVVIALITLLTALAVGSLGSVTWTQRLNEVSREFYAAVTKARAEAMRESRTSVVQLLLDASNDDDEFAVVAYFDENDNFVYDEGDDILIHRHLINQPFLTGSNAAISYAEKLRFDDGPSSTLITNVPDSNDAILTVPRTILFNNEGFSFAYGLTQSDVSLKAAVVDISDPINISGTADGLPFRRLEVTVAGAARIRACAGTCPGDP